MVPTDIGKIVNDFLVENFAGIMDFSFTANVEKEFDDIAEVERKTGPKRSKIFIGPFHERVEHVVGKCRDGQKVRDLLGVDPESGKNVYARLGRFGAMVQIGEATDEEKPKFASLQGEQTLGNITYEEAMDLFKLPKTVGEYEGGSRLCANGRFGPYVRFGKYLFHFKEMRTPCQCP